MIDNARLEAGLIHVARRYAPALVPQGWQQPGDYSGALPELAKALASFNLLLMAGEAPTTSIKNWTDGYEQFYQLLCGALFPSFTRVTAFYVDQQQPMIVAIYGEATPVIVTMAGLVAPYVVTRQGTRPLDLELIGMMDMILEDVEASDLPGDDYRRLREAGADALRQLLSSDVRQLLLTPPARPIFGDLRPATQTMTVAPVAPPQPADLPEPPAAPATMPEEIRAPPIPQETESQPPRRTFDPDAVPIFFNPGSSGQRGTNVPPAAPLPPPERR